MEMAEMMGENEDGKVVEEVRFVVDETEREGGYVTARPLTSLSVSVICLLYCRLLSLSLSPSPFTSSTLSIAITSPFSRT